MARSARFGSTALGTPGFSVRLDARTERMIQLVDEVSNNFRGGAFQRALAKSHEAAAEVVQMGMVTELRKQVKATGRRQRGSNYLEFSLLHENNVDTTATGYTVGRESWLERSPARVYYRRIEEGDNATFDGKILFTNDHPGLGGPYSAPWSLGGISFRQRWSLKNHGPEARDQPPGYKHIRMPQRRGAYVQNIGPYPAYRYSRGGLEAQRRLKMYGIYEKNLAAVGINITDVLTKEYRSLG